MKYNLVIVVFASIVINEVYSIVPKYESNDPVISKLISLDDTRYDGSYRQSKQLEAPKVVEDGIRKFTKKSQKSFLDLQPEDDSKKNRLPEVNIKDVINSKEVPIDESVEDFVDLSFEQMNSEEEANFFRQMFGSFSPVEYENKKRKQYYKEKRFAPSAYDGRYKYQDLNDVLKSITRNELQVKKFDKNLKMRQKRNSNIIEEENLVTTISIFKFTGRPSRLNEHLAFKNIHP